MRNDSPIPAVAGHFCNLAGEIISNWSFQIRLSERWHDTEALRAPSLGRFFEKVNDALIDNWFLAVARLHDRAVCRGNSNLSVDYMIDRSDFDASMQADLKVLREEMTPFVAMAIKPRDKLLAHNDITVIANIGSLGEFPIGADSDYIRHLTQFADIVSTRFCGGPFVFDDLISNDVDMVAHFLSRSLTLS